MIEYDFPAIIDYILGETSKSNLKRDVKKKIQFIVRNDKISIS
jgi:hypothetical protein